VAVSLAVAATISATPAISDQITAFGASTKLL